jgi:hypothetical protein
MRATILDGTPEEVAAALRLLNSAGPTAIAVPQVQRPSVHSSEDIEDTEYVSVEVARAVLTRIPLSTEQTSTLGAIYTAHPNMVPGTELGEAIGYSRSQFAGLMGAFGRRVAHTVGYVEGTSFFVQKWPNGAECWQYGLPESVREALRLENLV